MLIYIKPDKEPVRLNGEKIVVISGTEEGFRVRGLINDVMDFSYPSLPLDTAMFVASEHLQGRDPDKAIVLRLSKAVQRSETKSVKQTKALSSWFQRRDK